MYSHGFQLQSSRKEKLESRDSVYCMQVRYVSSDGEPPVISKRRQEMNAKVSQRAPVRACNGGPPQAQSYVALCSTLWSQDLERL